MALDFVETLQLLIPDVQTKLSEFEEGDYRENHGLIIEIAAIHEGLTNNYNYYSADALESSLDSWTNPYPKPIILNHDPLSESVGRVMGARMDKSKDGTPYVRLQTAITDPVAIQKVSDKRYLTGSVGGRAEESVCNICDTDWAAPRESAGLPCIHQRGKIYSGKIAYIQQRGIVFKEYSFVNHPSDERSGVITVADAAQAEESEFTRPRFYVLDMLSEGVVEVKESENRDVLLDMRKKEAQPLYRGLKGSFLLASAAEDLSENEISEETNMAKNAEVTVEDDILAVTEGLSKDLAENAAEEESTDAEGTDEVKAEEEEVEETPTEEVAAEEAPAEEAADEDADAEVKDEAAAEENTEEASEETEGERPQGQEKPHATDVDPETSAGAPKNRESEEDVSSDDDVTPEESTDEAKDSVVETELSGTQDDSNEPRVEELEAEIVRLKEENQKLRAALHRTLVERVVDAKISVGVVESADREDAIKEHEGRTAASLADSLRDLSALPKVAPKSLGELKVNETSEVVTSDEPSITIGERDDSDHTVDPVTALENRLVDALTGRKPLQ